MNLVKSLKSSGTLGTTSVVASVLSYALAFEEHIRQKSVTSYVLLIATFSLFYTGAYLAWKHEHDALLQVQALNAAPQFDVKASREARWIRDKSAPLKPSLLIFASVVNKVDAPSTLRSLSIQTDGKQMPASFFEATTVTFFRGETVITLNGTPAELQRSSKEEVVDLMPEVKRNPLVRGKHVEGWLLFEGFSSIQLYNSPLRFFLLAEDAFGTLHYSKEISLNLETTR